jgi:hypothetical protein
MYIDSLKRILNLNTEYKQKTKKQNNFFLENLKFESDKMQNGMIYYGILDIKYCIKAICFFLPQAETSRH